MNLTVGGLFVVLAPKDRLIAPKRSRKPLIFRVQITVLSPK
jgi:hypothetical protein